MTRALLSGRLWTAGLGIVFLGAAACGRGGSSTKASADDPTDSTQSSHIDNCSLVTDAEASSLGGRELKHDEDSMLGCPYINVRPGSVRGQLTVLALRGKGPAKDNFGDYSKDLTVLDIPGVGDSAAALVRDGHVNFLIVQKGSRYVQFVTTFISEMEPGSPKLKEAGDLAVKALDRMK